MFNPYALINFELFMLPLFWSIAKASLDQMREHSIWHLVSFCYLRGICNELEALDLTNS